MRERLAAPIVESPRALRDLARSRFFSGAPLGTTSSSLVCWPLYMSSRGHESGDLNVAAESTYASSRGGPRSATQAFRRNMRGLARSTGRRREWPRAKNPVRVNVFPPVSRRERPGRWSLITTLLALGFKPSTLPSMHQSMYERPDSLESAITRISHTLFPVIFKTSMGNCRQVGEGTSYPVRSSFQSRRVTQCALPTFQSRDNSSPVVSISAVSVSSKMSSFWRRSRSS